MRLTGTLRNWQDDRGFGFIAPTHGGPELFVHISALPRDGSRPTEGERVTYELGRGKNGKPQAVNVQRLALGSAGERSRVHRPEPRDSGSWFVRLVVLVMLVAVGAFAFNQYQKRAARVIDLPEFEPVIRSESTPSRGVAPAPAAEPAPTEATKSFRCDGRTYCSQMTSCTEAKFFLANCPGTKMDGNNDGTPCAQQWCTNLLSK